ncbi:MAG: (2Fe-2S)-binding protein [Burkholderiaceae bacterium]
MSRQTPSKPPSRVNPQRRDFLGSCSSAAAFACAANPVIAAAAGPAKKFAPSLLTDVDGAPLHPDNLQSGTEYIFHYPFRSTPCFLVDLGKPISGGKEMTQSNGETYQWQGGVGPNRSIVAFSAICAHKLSHPSPVVSFIGYREYPVGFLNRSTGQIEQRAGVIQCCSEHSIYDPAEGAAVVSGPAPQPLAAVALSIADDSVVATGVYGGNMFNEYFERFGDRLMLEYRSDSYADPVGPSTTVVPGDQFTKNKMRCG